MPKERSAEKRAVRARMAETGENYTTALRRHREERAAAEADSVVVKLSDGEIWVSEDCPVPGETVQALNATSPFLAPDFGKATDGG